MTMGVEEKVDMASLAGALCVEYSFCFRDPKYQPVEGGGTGASHGMCSEDVRPVQRVSHLDDLAVV